MHRPPKPKTAGSNPAAPASVNKRYYRRALTVRYFQIEIIRFENIGFENNSGAAPPSTYILTTKNRGWYCSRAAAQ